MEVGEQWEVQLARRLVGIVAPGLVSGDAQELRATELLAKHRLGLDLVAEALIEKETIDGAEVARIVQDHLNPGQTLPIHHAPDDNPVVDIAPGYPGPDA